MLGLNHLRRHVERRLNSVANLTNVQNVIDFNNLSCPDKKACMHEAANIWNALINNATLNQNARRIGHELIWIARFGAPDKVLVNVSAGAASYIAHIYSNFSSVNLDRHEVEREFCDYFYQELEYHLSIN